MSPFRSVGARLSLALVFVVAIALGVVYAIVVPLLERNLTQAKLDQLTRSAVAEGRLFPEPDGGFGLGSPSYRVEIDEYIEEAAAATNARVVLFRPLASEQLSVLADSRETRAAPDVSGDQVALTAALTLATERGTVTRDGEQFAEVAIPVLVGFFEPSVLLFTASLDDTLANVDLVKRRVLVAGGIALLVALLLGFGGASVFARRIRRLERAADRIAGGELDEPVLDRGSDELGQLAAAFERMRKRLAQLEHTRREFIANASHELRTPIFSLGGFLELLDDEELDDETRREFLITMQSQVERLTKLATDLLDLSRLDAGQLRIELGPVRLRDLAEALAGEFAARALAEQQSLTVVGPEDAPAALGDDERVLQIGRVLVENSLLHTPPGTTVRIRVGEEDGRAVLAVEDEGQGIPFEHTDDVFERFYRLEGTAASGSGLGLAIARELAEAMEGTLELEPRPGCTVFVLRLPVAPAGVPFAAAERPSAVPG
jgi:signal transduction histidine kinase